MRRETPGQRAHRGPRQRDTVLQRLRLLARAAAATCAGTAFGLCVEPMHDCMAEITSPESKLYENGRIRAASGRSCVPILMRKCSGASSMHSVWCLREEIVPSLTLLSVV